jgi:hypothetical protein
LGFHYVFNPYANYGSPHRLPSNQLEQFVFPAFVTQEPNAIPAPANFQLFKNYTVIVLALLQLDKITLWKR